MLVEDNLKDVLMKSDITTIKQLVLVNKNMELYCNDSSFWKNKFMHDGLLIINDKLNTFKEWVEEYELILKCKNDCINILLVNKIESQQTYTQSDYINIFYGCKHDTSIPHYMLGKMDIQQIQIGFLSDDAGGTYKILYYTNKNSYWVENSLYPGALYILIKMMYYSFKDTDIKITDNLTHEKYTFNKIIQYEDSISEDELVLIQRQIIYNTLKTLNLLSGI